MAMNLLKGGILFLKYLKGLFLNTKLLESNSGNCQSGT